MLTPMSPKMQQVYLYEMSDQIISDINSGKYLYFKLHQVFFRSLFLFILNMKSTLPNLWLHLNSKNFQ
jgi:hypothetical protein